MMRSAVYGFVVADAVGVPYEFRKRGSFQAIGMVGYGTHNQPAGTWSDDSSMLIATFESLNRLKKIDSEDIMQNFCKWYQKSEFTAHGTVFDIGNTTARSIVNYLKERNIETCGGREHWDNGNGALMRVLPLAFTSATDDEINEVTALTHNHEISKEASRIYVHIARGLMLGESIRDLLKQYTLSPKFQHILNIYEIKEEDIRSGGYVIDTLTAALWCLVHTNNYRDCVLKAVNLGEDTDTTAAVAGGLAGIMYRYDAIPKEWIEALQNKKIIKDIIRN